MENTFSARNPPWRNGNIATGQINSKSQPYKAGSVPPKIVTLIGMGRKPDDRSVKTKDTRLKTNVEAT